MIVYDLKSIESRRQAMQLEIDAKNSQAERNRLGQFATPNLLAVDIARYVASLSLQDNLIGKIRFADPSIGTGSFYSAMLAAFATHQVESAIGIELDPVFAATARELWSTSGLTIQCADFTRLVESDACPLPPNLLLANPPYVRHHHLDSEEKKRLQQLAFSKTGVTVNGLAGLYVYFLLIATAWMQKDGIAAWLIPSEFMDVNYGAALKKFLAERVTLLRVHRFDPNDVQFGDALVSSVVVVFRKSIPPPEHAAQFSFGGTLQQPNASEFVSLDRLRSTRKWTTFPAHAKNDRQTVSDGSELALGDLFRIQRGIATGCNKFFILERATAQRLGLPPQYLRPILPSPRHLKTTLIESSDDGYPLLDSPLCVIDCDLPESVVEEQYPELWRYLQSADALGVLNGYLIGKRRPWYKQEQRQPAPFLCTYMGRGANEKQPFRFIWNCSQAIATNLYLILYPRPVLSEMLRLHPERTRDIHELLSQVSGHELRGEGRVYGGGLNKIEPRELGRISAFPFVELWPELQAKPARQVKLFD